jgi:hypothetical protein
VLGVEAERGGDDYGVEVFAVEEGAEVAVGRDFIAADVVELGEAGGVDVGGGGDFYAGDTEEAADEFLGRSGGRLRLRLRIGRRR